MRWNSQTTATPATRRRRSGTALLLLLAWATLLPCVLAFPHPPLSSSQLQNERLLRAHTDGTAAAATSASSRRLRPGVSRLAKTETDDGLPLVPAGQLLLDQDPRTTVIDSVLSASVPSYTRSILFDPAAESLCFFLNNSLSGLSMQLSFPGGTTSQLQAQDVNLDYLPLSSRPNMPYQSAIVKPSVLAIHSMCNHANGTMLSRCQVDLTVSLPIGSTNTIPFHLSIMQSPVLPFGVNPGLVGGTRGQLISYSMDAKQSDLPIVVWMRSEQNSNHMLYWFNARNPLQYFAPEFDEFEAMKDDVGSQIGMWLSPSYGSRPAPTASTSNILRKLPSSGGNARADPLYMYGADSLNPDGWSELYIVGVWPLGSSAPSVLPSTHRFEIEFVRNYAVPEMDVNLGLSMFGVVGALTVLVLCLFSAAAIVIKRRSQANQLHVEEMAAIGIILRRNREGAEAADADRPAFDAEGRPLRYDAHGRVIPDLGAKKEVIAALPTRVFVSGMLPDEDAHCTICLGEYEAGETIKELPCAHVFHDACISKWLLQKGHCVLCQQKLADAVPQGQGQARIINVAPAAADVAAGEVAPLAASAGSGSAESPTASPYRGTQQSPDAERSSWMRREPDAAGGGSSSSGHAPLSISHPLSASPRGGDRDLPSRSGPRSVAQPHAIILHYDDADPDPSAAPPQQRSRQRRDGGLSGGGQQRQPTPPGSVNEAAVEGKEAEEERSERSVPSRSRSTQLQQQQQGGVTLVAVRPQQS